MAFLRARSDDAETKDCDSAAQDKAAAAGESLLAPTELDRGLLTSVTTCATPPVLLSNEWPAAEASAATGAAINAESNTPKKQ